MGEHEMWSGDETGLGASGGCSGSFFFYNDRVLGSWILFSSAIGERSRAWTALSVGPVFISGAALGVIHKHIKLKRNAWPQRDFPAGPVCVCVCMWG